MFSHAPKMVSAVIPINIFSLFRLNSVYVTRLILLISLISGLKFGEEEVERIIIPHLKFLDYGCFAPDDRDELGNLIPLYEG